MSEFASTHNTNVSGVTTAFKTTEALRDSMEDGCCLPDVMMVNGRRFDIEVISSSSQYRQHEIVVNGQTIGTVLADREGELLFCGVGAMYSNVEILKDLNLLFEWVNSRLDTVLDDMKKTIKALEVKRDGINHKNRESYARC